jgi:hypothetical protein
MNTGSLLKIESSNFWGMAKWCTSSAGDEVVVFSRRRKNSEVVKVSKNPEEVDKQRWKGVCLSWVVLDRLLCTRALHTLNILWKTPNSWSLLAFRTHIRESKIVG